MMKTGNRLPGKMEMVDPRVAVILRRKTPAERIAMMLESNRLMRLLIEGPLRERHPEWSDEQVQAAVARRMLRDAGTAPEVHC